MNPIFSRSFTKSLLKLDQTIQEAFYKRLRLLSTEPHHSLLNNHALHGKFSDKRSINITGDYRALFKKDGDVIIFTDIGTHPQLYG